MRVITLEEHFTLPFVAERVGAERIKRRGFPPADMNRNLHLGPLLADMGDKRVADLDEHGISLQVMSSSGPGADLVEGEAGVSLAREMNDRLGESVTKHKGRLAGFAHLPMHSPEAAALELERCVKHLGFLGGLINGVTEDLFLDDPRFDPILAKAVELDTPIYVHPSLPPEPVNRIYYERLPGRTGAVLASAGWGWHSETALHILRMVVAGTLDRHPKLRLIIGHMGEGLPAALERCDDVLGPVTKHLTRGVSQTILDQVWITTAGFLHMTPFLAALTTFGADRILFSVDYPYTTNAKAKPFLDSLPVSPADLHKIAHGNAERVLKLPTA
ncbi:MAG TPA: amidohydrolase family protein [Beijerinckiaceae bacterium]|nr:amidohydrolase family protein [Beijerinckiaceae bacterium]